VSERASLRVVATHDFCCAYPPSPTSYGSLPGGEGLKNTVDALREQGPTLRAEAGDFAAPGALATISGGKVGFAAAADLGIDVGVVGNHEFEWGVSTYARTRRRRASRCCAPTPPRSDCPRRLSSIRIWA
jgi:2',3'-cyclic-nucleotide 2'-phosphodiesterase (5'-nucleotidase family)